MTKKLSASSGARADVVNGVTKDVAATEEKVRMAVRNSSRSAKEAVSLLAVIDDYVNAVKEEIRVRSFV